jgi:hypothetical protein
MSRLHSVDLKPSAAEISRRCTGVHSYVLLELPSEDEIAVTEERKTSEMPFLIRKTIRYRNGAKIILIQDFHERVFRVEIDCDPARFLYYRSGILKV